MLPILAISDERNIRNKSEYLELNYSLNNIPKKTCLWMEFIDPTLTHKMHPQ